MNRAPRASPAGNAAGSTSSDLRRGSFEYGGFGLAFAHDSLRHRQERKQRADVGVALDGKPKRQVPPDRVEVPAACSLAFDVSRAGEVGHDPLRPALGDPEKLGDVADPDLGVLRDQEQRLAVIREEGELR